ncbi:hypothetical protein D9M68_733550 [compost metagenome]
MAQAGLPGAELSDQVVARQAEQAGDGGLPSCERFAVAVRTGGQLARRVAAPDQRLAARELIAGRIDRLWRRVRQIEPREVLGDLAQVAVGQVVEQRGHALVLAPAVPEMLQLVVQVARGLARDAREIAGTGGAAFFAVAQGAGHHTLGHGVGHGARRRLGGHRSAEPEQCRKDGGNGGSKQGHRRFESTTGAGPIH